MGRNETRQRLKGRANENQKDRPSGDVMKKEEKTVQVRGVNVIRPSSVLIGTCDNQTNSALSGY